MSGSGTGTPVSTNPDPSHSSPASKPRNSLPLETWRRIIGLNPWHFWGLASNDMPITSACLGLVPQYSWQLAQAMGRFEIADAISQAEAKASLHLNFWPGKHWANKILSWPKYFDKHAYRRAGAASGSGQRIGVNVGEGFVRAIGVETTTLIQANTVLTFSDADGDGIDDTFTLSAPTSVTDADQIAVYFSSADRLTFNTFEDAKVDALNVSIGGGTVTITGRIWQIVRPILYENPTLNAIDPTNLANFAATLDIYWKYTNRGGTDVDTCQSVLLWDTLPSMCNCLYPYTPNINTDPAAEAQAVARAGLRDAELGIVIPAAATYNATDGTWSQDCINNYNEPDRVLVRFCAGRGYDDQRLERLIAVLATAEMSSRICACDDANKRLHEWQFDLARSAGVNDEQYSIDQKDLGNPFGTKRGHVWAWRQVQQLALGGATLP